MRCAADAAMARRRFVGVGPQPRNKTPKIIGRHPVPCEQQPRRARGQSDRFEIVEHVVGKRIGGAVNHVRRPAAVTDRETIRCGVGHPAGPYAAPRSDDVFDNDRLAERSPHAARNDSADGGHGPTCVRVLRFPPATPEIAIVSLCELGDRAMWIVMYVAMIASLSAMGMVPVAETGDPLPLDDA